MPPCTWPACSRPADGPSPYYCAEHVEEARRNELRPLGVAAVMSPHWRRGDEVWMAREIEFLDEDAADRAEWERILAMSEDEIDAELRAAGIDPDESYERLRAKALLKGIDLPPAAKRKRGRC